MKKEVGVGAEEKENGASCSPEGEHRHHESIVLRLFSLSLAGGNHRGGLRGEI